MLLGAEAAGWSGAVAGLVENTDDTVNIAAFDDSLSGITGNTFTLATFSFLGQGLGTSSLIASDGPSGGLLLDVGELDLVLGAVDATGSVTVAPVPEPGTALLFSLGLVGLAGARRKYGKA